MLAGIFSNANDAITAILAVAIAALLRGIWTLQQRIARLEGIDEQRERQLSLDRAEERVVRSPMDHPYDQEED